MLLKLLILVLGLSTVGGSCDCSGSSGDPHFRLAHGGATDYRGGNGELVNLLSSQNVSLNAMTEDATFMLNKVTVHGSFLTQVHLVMRTRDDRLFNISYKTSELNEYGWNWRMLNATCTRADQHGPLDSLVKGKERFTLYMHKHAECGNLRVSIDLTSVNIEADEWKITIRGMPVPNRISGPRHRIDLEITQKVADHEFAVVPHGIIGQSFDGIAVPRVGKLDVYPPLNASVEFTTTAMGEGAIEGTADEYKVASPFQTEYKYSRFGLPTEAKRAPGTTDIQTAYATDRVAGAGDGRRLSECDCGAGAPPPASPSPPSQYATRLSSYPEGRLDVYVDGTWYPMCGHYFWGNHLGATTACQSMGRGYTSGLITDYRVSHINGGLQTQGHTSSVGFFLNGQCKAGEAIGSCTDGGNCNCADCSWCGANPDAPVHQNYCTASGGMWGGALGITVRCS